MYLVTIYYSVEVFSLTASDHIARSLSLLKGSKPLKGTEGNHILKYTIYNFVTERSHKVGTPLYVTECDNGTICSINIFKLYPDFAVQIV